MNTFGLKGIVIEVISRTTRTGRQYHIVRLRTEPRNSGSVTASVPVFSEPPRIGEEVCIRGFLKELSPGRGTIPQVSSIRPARKRKRNRREESEP